jgi:hypothetical protein
MAYVHWWAQGYFLDTQTGDRRSKLVNHALGSAGWQRYTVLDHARRTNSLDHDRRTGSRR